MLSFDEAADLYDRARPGLACNHDGAIVKRFLYELHVARRTSTRQAD